MASLLSSSKVTVHIGDGFKFLSTHKATYDVIITDSSDPVGPAASLFQKPYFQLLYDALTPGGHIATQGECLWLHLPLITELLTVTRAMFPVAAYAYGTVPTYPSGQIGYIVCSKAPGRDLTKVLREPVGETKYWNKELHRAAFILPEFGRALLEDGKDVLPKFGRALKDIQNQSEGTGKKKVLLLGSGYVARPCAEYLVRDPAIELTIGMLSLPLLSTHLTCFDIACRTLTSAQSLAGSLPSTQAISLDVTSTPALEGAIAEHDLVISLIPYTYHAAVIKAAIKSKTHVVTTSYVSPAMRALDQEARDAGIVVMNEIGLDPGIDHLYAVKTIGEVHEKGGKVRFPKRFCSAID
jgi:spermidine synthase / saccharopine dehydrogenase (NADP+, L-glutamate-forming)